MDTSKIKNFTKSTILNSSFAIILFGFNLGHFIRKIVTRVVAQNAKKKRQNTNNLTAKIYGSQINYTDKLDG